MKIGIYCYLIEDILTNFLQKYSLSSPSKKQTKKNIWILFKQLNLIGNRKAKFAKKYSNIISSEAIREMKLKLYRNVHNISLYKNVFLLLLLMHFGCYGNLHFPLTCNGKKW